MSRLRVDRGPLVSHVGNEAALEQLALFYGILTIFVPHLPSCVLYCNIYNLTLLAVMQPRRSFRIFVLKKYSKPRYFPQIKPLPRDQLCRTQSESCRQGEPLGILQSPRHTRPGFLSWQSQPQSKSPVKMTGLCFRSVSVSQMAHLNSILVGERSGGNLGRGVSRSVVKRSSVRSMVRTVVRTMGWTDGAELRGSQGDSQAS